MSLKNRCIQIAKEYLEDQNVSYEDYEGQQILPFVKDAKIQAEKDQKEIEEKGDIKHLLM